MRPVTLAAALALALGAAAASAQNATSGLAVVPGLNGESSGTVTGAGDGREGLFGSPADANEPRAAKRSDAKGADSAKAAEGAGRGTGTGTKKRGSAAAGADPR